VKRTSSSTSVSLMLKEDDDSVPPRIVENRVSPREKRQWEEESGRRSRRSQSFRARGLVKVKGTD
jgi:hypothetical protein